MRDTTIREQVQLLLRGCVEVIALFGAVSVLFYTAAIVKGEVSDRAYLGAMVTTGLMAVAYYWPNMRRSRAMSRGRGVYFVWMRLPLAATGPFLLSALGGRIEGMPATFRTVFALLLIAWRLVVGLQIKMDLGDHRDGTAVPERDGELGPKGPFKGKGPKAPPAIRE